MEYVIEMLGITKDFPGIRANDDVTLQLKKGEIHALLGENGAGKSTLMSILFGLYKPDKGEIRVSGKKVVINSPLDANNYKIGMVHQHFKLVENFTVTENIILGMEPTKSFSRVDMDTAEQKIKALSEKYGLNVNPKAKIEDISVGMQQRVEILKMLYREADILIFDEPTAVLTPQEIEELMAIIKSFAKQDKSIIIITHKLKEIKAIADRCTILRRGKYIDTVDVAQTTETQLAEKMVGREVTFKVDKAPKKVGNVVLDIQNLTVKDNRGIEAVKDLSLIVKEGEILGVAGIDGNGQTELIEAITGLRKIDAGQIIVNGQDITSASIRNCTESGIAHIPEDRHKHGLVLDFSLAQNILLQTYYQEPYAKKGIIQFDKVNEKANQIIEEFDVRSGRGADTLVRSMSGGNQQKAIIGREIDRSPALLIAAQPTRGLDVGAIEYIHKRIVEERDKGRAVLLISFELDEILNLADHIAVIYEGKMVGDVRPEDTDENEIGLMMSGSKRVGV